MSDYPRMTSDDYAARGVAYEQAFDIIVQGCEIPYSLECFDAAMRDLKQRSGESFVSPQYVARHLAETYRRAK